MNKFFIVVGQVAVGYVVGNMLDKVVNSVVVDNIKKAVVKGKKEKGA